jgi:hypothetical protein
MKTFMKIFVIMTVLMIGMTVMVQAQTPDPRVNGILDWRFYLDKYPDVKNMFGNNARAAQNHWLRFGLAECRQSSADFNIDYYLNSHSDLVNAFGTDCVKALDHWLNFGKKEGRKTAGIKFTFTNNTRFPIEIFRLVGQKETLEKTLPSNNSLTDYQPGKGCAYTSDCTFSWRIKVVGNIITDYYPSPEYKQLVQIDSDIFEAGPIFNGEDAKTKCANKASDVPGGWVGSWRTTVAGKMSVCEIAFLNHK